MPEVNPLISIEINIFKWKILIFTVLYSIWQYFTDRHRAPGIRPSKRIQGLSKWLKAQAESSKRSANYSRQKNRLNNVRRLRLWLRFQPIGLTGRWVEAYGSESRLHGLVVVVVVELDFPINTNLASFPCCTKILDLIYKMRLLKQSNIRTVE